jgi:hypothetical protein
MAKQNNPKPAPRPTPRPNPSPGTHERKGRTTSRPPVKPKK